MNLCRCLFLLTKVDGELRGLLIRIENEILIDCKLVVEVIVNINDVCDGYSKLQTV